MAHSSKRVTIPTSDPFVMLHPLTLWSELAVVCSLIELSGS